MKRFFTALIVLIVTALAMPRVVFAADEPLEDIPARRNSESSKAYCLYEKTGDEYTLTCVNSAGTKLLYRSEEKFKHNESFSDDGKTLYYSINGKVYKYSYESGKRQKIYAADNSQGVYVTLYSSPNGEYCLICTDHYSGYNNDDIDLVIWHKGKTVSQNEKTCFDIWGGDELFGINDKGEVFYTLDRDIYILDFDGKRLAQKAPVPLSDNEDEYDIFEYETDIYPQSGTYIVQDGKDLYFGALGGKQNKLSFSEDAGYDVIARNGKGLILYNGEYVARYDIKSGKCKNILKISPENYRKKRLYFIRTGDGLNKVVFINYSNKTLVRLSGWDDEKNRYTQKQEIKLNGTGRENISNYTSDLNTILIDYADEKNNCWTADFESGSFVQTEYWHKTDRFGHMIVHNYYEKIKIIDLDGSETEVFDNVGITCEPYLSNGFYVFYSGGPNERYDYKWGEYPLTYYYIDKNGKAVKWFEVTVYMEIMF